MTARIRETDGQRSFVCECDCTGEWEPLLEVRDAESDFASWNYNHGLGGLSLECTSCRTTYVLGGQAHGFGLPDLIEARELFQIPRLELTRLQRRALDISLTAENTLWCKAMDLVADANKEQDTDLAESLWLAAKLLLGALHREKRETLRAILAEHGIEGVPKTLRIARLSDGSGAIYSADRGPLPVRKKAVLPEPTRIPDFEERPVSPVSEQHATRVVDLT